MKFDLDLPENCPKPEVGEFEGIAYRVVQNNPPTEDDLLTYIELRRCLNSDPCKRGSISLLSNLDQAQHRLDISPSLGKFVASITLTKAHGKVSKPSISGHIDWWPYEGMRNPNDLQVIS